MHSALRRSLDGGFSSRCGPGRFDFVEPLAVEANVAEEPVLEGDGRPTLAMRACCCSRLRAVTDMMREAARTAGTRGGVAQGHKWHGTRVAHPKRASDSELKTVLRVGACSSTATQIAQRHEARCERHLEIRGTRTC